MFSDELQIRRNSTKEQEFVIDSTIGKNTLVTIFYQENVQVQVRGYILHAPHSKNCYDLVSGRMKEYSPPSGSFYDSIKKDILSFSRFTL